MVENQPIVKYVDSDIPCRRCGYNLRGLLELGRCPECHAPVMLALLPSDLPIVDPEWIERIARGCRITTWSVCTALVSFIVIVAFGVIGISTGIPPQVGVAIVACWSLLAVLCLVVAVVGLWITTRPHASFSGPGQALQRRTARVCLALFPATVIGCFFLERTQNTAACIVPIGLGCPVGIGGLVGLWSFSKYVEAIGRSLGDPISTRKGPWYRWGFSLGWIVGWIGVAGSATQGGFGFVVAMLIGGPLMFAYGFLTVGLATYLNAALPKYLAAAKDNWRKAEAEAQTP